MRVLLFFLFVNISSIYAQSKNNWSVKYFSLKDTIESGEGYKAYITVNNNAIEESSIEIEVSSGRKLKKDASGRFVYQTAGLNYKATERYKKVNQQFKIKCSDADVKEHILVHSYFVKYKDKSEGNDKEEIGAPDDGEPIEYLYVPEMPKFKASEKYRTYNDYLNNEIKARQVKAESNLFVEIGVDEDGGLYFKSLPRGIIDAENLDKLISIIEDSPKWIPAKYENKAVRVKKVILVKFE